MFDLKLLPRIELESKETPEGRFYRLPSGDFVGSVTTILSFAKDKTKLNEWKHRVGEQQANKKSKQAKLKGTELHNLLEKYLLNEKDYALGAMPLNVSSFKKIQPILETHVSTVYGIEFPLYSEKLQTAGRSDLIAAWDNELAIIDFKTSEKPKRAEWIEDYFLQSTCYAMMVEELFNIQVPKIAILIAVDFQEPQLFIRNKNDYIQLVENIFIRNKDEVFV